MVIRRHGDVSPIHPPSLEEFERVGRIRGKSPRTHLNPGEVVKSDTTRSGDSLTVHVQVHNHPVNDIGGKRDPKSPELKRSKNEVSQVRMANDRQRSPVRENAGKRDRDRNPEDKPTINGDRSPSRSRRKETPDFDRRPRTPPKDTDEREEVIGVPRDENKNQTARASDYRDLWQLRSTLEMQHTSEESGSSEYDTVIGGSAEEETILPQLLRSPTLEEESSGQEKSDGKSGIDDSFEHPVSSISAEESDMSERDRDSGGSGKDGPRNLRTMHGDSGYASIEQKTETEWKRRQMFAASDHESTSFESAQTFTMSSDSSSPTVDKPVVTAVVGRVGEEIKPLTRNRGDRRTASTKRREFVAGREEAIFGSFSFPEEETETSGTESTVTTSKDSDQTLGERRGALRERKVRRTSPLARSREDGLSCYPKGRDYSIDEKTDALFKEFIKQDVLFDTNSRRSRPYRSHRLQLHNKQHSDSMLEYPTKVGVSQGSNEPRSVSFESRTGAGSSAKERLTTLLPGTGRSKSLISQDSIEEEYLSHERKKIYSAEGSPESKSSREPSREASRDPSRETSREPSPTGDTTTHVNAPYKHPMYDPHDKSATIDLPPRLEDVKNRRSAFRLVKKSPQIRRAGAASFQECAVTAFSADLCDLDNERERQREGVLSRHSLDLRDLRERQPIEPPTILVGGYETPDEQQRTPERDDRLHPREKSLPVSPILPIRREQSEDFTRYPRPEERSRSPRSRRHQRFHDISPNRGDSPGRGVSPGRGSNVAHYRSSKSPTRPRRSMESLSVDRGDRGYHESPEGRRDFLQVPGNRGMGRSASSSPRHRLRKHDTIGGVSRPFSEECLSRNDEPIRDHPEYQQTFHQGRYVRPFDFEKLDKRHQKPHSIQAEKIIRFESTRAGSETALLDTREERSKREARRSPVRAHSDQDVLSDWRRNGDQIARSPDKF